MARAKKLILYSLFATTYLYGILYKNGLEGKNKSDIMKIREVNRKYMVKFSEKDIKKFKRMGVLAVYLFGSRVENKYIHAMSDFDFGIVFENFKRRKDNGFDAYSELYDVFSDILPKEYLKKRFEEKVHEFDIVFLQNVSINLQFEAIKGEVLYESDKEKRLDYEEYVVNMQCDLEQIHKAREEIILERI